MKWKDLSLKERKQIYDSVRVNNPGATYFDIKQQFDSIPEYEDGKDESVAASFSLPEVNIYPQNRFGDIARTQGYETAKNWKKVKEGTTAGINTFINSPHAQFVQTMLPLPDGLEHLGSGIKQVKQFIKSESDRYARNVYNNLMPMSYYSSYTNHELGHVADGLAGSRKIQDFDSGKEYITNTYLNYLANSNNTYSSAELRKMGLFDAAGSRSYLLNPTEAKSHMLTLKRSLKDSGKITNWSTPVDENMILEYMRNPTSNKMVKNQYDLYRNKNEYIDRLNKLIPMEILMPLGGAGFVGHELNKE